MGDNLGPNGMHADAAAGGDEDFAVVDGYAMSGNPL
jgi:hypothetical protein